MKHAVTVNHSSFSASKLVAFVLLVAASGCQHDRTNAGPAPISSEATVAVANYPLQYFAQRIGGEHVSVQFPLASSDDFRRTALDAEEVQKLQAASLVLLNGAGYEKWLNTISLADSKLVDTSEQVSDRFVAVSQATSHSHGPGAKFANQRVAFAVWLDPKLATAQVDSIKTALAEIQPQHETRFRAAADELKSELEALDRSLQAAFEPVSGEQLLLADANLLYWSARYEFEARLCKLDWSHDEAEKSLAAEFEGETAKWLLTTSPMSSAAAAVLEEKQIQVIQLDLCESNPEIGDYVDAMRKNCEYLRAAFARN